MRSLRLAAILFALCAPAPALAAAGGAGMDIAVDGATTLEWQRVQLEDRLQDKITRALAPTLPEKSYVVQVSIQLKEKLKQENVDKGVEKAKDAPKEDDRVPLGKLDIDAPVIGFDVDETNLFKNIQKASVTILLDNGVPDSKTEVVTKIVNSAVAGIGKDPADVKTDKVDLVVKEHWDAKKVMTEFKEPIGFLAATLVLGLLLFAMVMMVFGGYKNLETRKIAVMEAQNTREDAAAQAASASKEEEIKIDEKEEAADGHGPAVGHVEGSQSGFEKLRALLKESPEKASALVKQWVKAPGKGASEALAILPQMLTTEEFMSIFKYLSMDDRKAWKKQFSGYSMTTDSLAVGDAFISAQIVDSLLVPPHEVDQELRGMLTDLHLSECVELATQDQGFGALLVNLLPTAQVSRMFSLMAPELANTVTVASLKFSNEELDSRSSALKEAIKALKAKEKSGKVPFLEKASELLRDVGPDKEASIFGALVESGEFQLLAAAARQFFPAELLVKLPPKILKSCLERFPLGRRAELIVSRPDEEKNILLETIGKPGTKARDLIDVEVTQVSSDELRRRRVDKNKEAMWREFIESSRSLLRASEAASEQAEGILNQWLSDKTGGAIGGSDGVGTNAA